MNPALATLAGHFALLSLIAFGGASAVVPEMQRLVVERMQWMSTQQFTDLFAIAQAAPGPNVLVVTLIGWQVAGLSGALTATVAFCLPGGALAYAAAGLWERFRDHPWRARIQAGLAPVTVGLIASTAWILARSAAGHHGGGLVVALCSTAFALRTSLNPLWMLGAGAALGLSGLL